jgi:hypothetical protein
MYALNHMARRRGGRRLRAGRRVAVAAAVVALGVAGPAGLGAQVPGHAGHGAEPAHATFELGGGWRLLGMAQVFPMVTTGFGSGANDAVTTTEIYATQPAVMFNIESPRSTLVLRTTLNFEGVTQPDGELTFGGWGEGFIDRRHPHTLLHEAMLSLNLRDVAGGELSLSAGRGFAPFGTDDPMARPAVKFPTNHHLSQILERYVVSGAYRNGPWSVEAGMFAGDEPTGPYDFGNIDGFPNSWSARLARRFGGVGPHAPWEVAGSFGHVVEEHRDERHVTRLVNGYVRHDREHRFGRLYALVESSVSIPAADDEDGYFSVLAESQLTRGAHRPYVRLELATRPEYERDDVPGGDGFFRYDHDARPIAATRWFIATAGYGYEGTPLPYSARPFVEVQFNNAVNQRGQVAAGELFGTTRFFTLSAGARFFLGGGPMRMGSYGVLDAMTEHARVHAPPAPQEGGEHRHH